MVMRVASCRRTITHARLLRQFTQSLGVTFAVMAMPERQSAATAPDAWEASSPLGIAQRKPNGNQRVTADGTPTSSPC